MQEQGVLPTLHYGRSQFNQSVIGKHCKIDIGLRQAQQAVRCGNSQSIGQLKRFGHSATVDASNGVPRSLELRSHASGHTARSYQCYIHSQNFSL